MKFFQKKIQQDVFKTGSKTGMDNSTPSFSQYFSWINNTNEGSTEAQTLINLNFFKWLQSEFGMILDIYAFDAGNLDGPSDYYGDFESNKFRSQFPNGFKPISDKAREMGTKLGMWGGPDGFGNTPEEELERHERLVSLCRDYEFSLFKIDGVCGQLRPSKQEAYLRTLIDCRKHQPNLIVLNHRLFLGKAFPYVTTFLLGGRETYIDVHMANRHCAPHHREEALARAPPEDLIRLTEDHGVCISSANDFWEDDLILQAFNRCLILAPEIYGNPWLLPDEDYPKLARIYNLHRRYRDILVNGILLPETQYGKHAISRGSQNKRFLTLRNLSWEFKTFNINLDEKIGIKSTTSDRFVYQFHPTQNFLGKFNKEETTKIIIPPYRSCLLAVSTELMHEIGIENEDYEIIKQIPEQPIHIQLFGLPGTTHTIKLTSKPDWIQGEIFDENGKPINTQIQFESERAVNLDFWQDYHRKVAILAPISNYEKEIQQIIYEAQCFATDNNALEVRELDKVGASRYPAVQAAREAFFDQPIFREKGVWDKYALDGDRGTSFKVFTRESIPNRTLRIDFGEILKIDRLQIFASKLVHSVKVRYYREVEVYGSSDLITWESIPFTVSEALYIELNQKEIRYLKVVKIPEEVSSIKGFSQQKEVSRSKWRVSNLFSNSIKKAKKTWNTSFQFEEIPPHSYLALAVHGYHGKESIFAALKIEGKYYGFPDKAPAYPSNPWESWWRQTRSNTTYYYPLNSEHVGKSIEVILQCTNRRARITPELWITAHPAPFMKKDLYIS